MAGEIVTKKITELEENTTIDDADILMAGDKGTNALKRFTIGAFLTAIKAKLAAWTFDTLQTTSKTLPGAVNELNSKLNVFTIQRYETIEATVPHLSGLSVYTDTITPPEGYIMFHPIPAWSSDSSIIAGGCSIANDKVVVAIRNTENIEQKVIYTVHVIFIRK